MNLNVSIHDVTRVTTQAKCLNGHWATKLYIRCEDGSESQLTLHTGGARIQLQEMPDEHVRIEADEPKVTRSAAPFESACSAGEPSK